MDISSTYQIRVGAHLGVGGGHWDMGHVPLWCRRRPAAPLGALDGSDAPQAHSIHKSADKISLRLLHPSQAAEVKTPATRESVLIVFSAPYIHVSVLISHSMRPQLIHRRCPRPKRSQISPEGALLHIGHR